MLSIYNVLSYILSRERENGGSGIGNNVSTTESNYRTVNDIVREFSRSSFTE